ncbi:hypothetical protein N7457_001521 [Penicillium paradoxum]|uniref:uncharacterized protein n=1 Tax=Penicillium paradoxum TaxID=176176 RepID=UPI0025480628|nr:uncharacterized protein N7457_001521 [Penicillium paradoxum]KAJ5794922.1 hypothetical protein N7457_001521 [Penicillium paradoxum]
MSSPPDDTDLDALPETENDSGTSGYIYDQLMFYYPLDPPLAMVPVQYSTHEPMGVPSEDYALASQWFHPQPIDRSQHTMQCPSAANVNNHAQAISPASPDTMDSVQNPEGLIPPSTKKQLLQEPPCSQTMSENFNNGQNPRVYPQKPQQE